MPKVELPFEALLEATEQLDATQLNILSQRMGEVRRLQKKQLFHSDAQQTREKYDALSLSPHEWQRYTLLLNKRKAGHLNEEDESEWHFLATRSEELMITRVALLSDFAARHNLSLSEVTRRLKIKALEAVVV